MQKQTLAVIALAVAASLVAGVAGTLIVSKALAPPVAKPVAMDIHAQIFRATPARELIVMTADGRVFSGAQKDEFLQQSKLYYVSRGRFTYSVDMRTLGPSNFKYEASSDVLKVKLPNITVRTSVYGPRERIAALALLASEGTSGNELERVAAAALERDATQEAARPELMSAALTSAKYEVSKLYEDAFRASGRTTRVIVFASNEPLT